MTLDFIETDFLGDGVLNMDNQIVAQGSGIETGATK